VRFDGVYVGNYIRPANNIDDRIDRRKAHKPKKRVVISIRQRAESEFDEVVGAVKTKTFVVKSEAFPNNNLLSTLLKENDYPFSKLENIITSDLANIFEIFFLRVEILLYQYVYLTVEEEFEMNYKL